MRPLRIDPRLHEPRSSAEFDLPDYIDDWATWDDEDRGFFEEDWEAFERVGSSPLRVSFLEAYKTTPRSGCPARS